MPARNLCPAVALACLAMLGACGSDPSAGALNDSGIVDLDDADDARGADAPDGADANDDAAPLDADSTDALGDADADDDVDLDGSGSDADADAGVEFCDSDDDCAIGLCLQIDTGSDQGVCAQQCVDDQSCPEGSTCRRYINAGGDAVSVCVPDDLCIDADGDRFGFGNGCLGPDCDDSSDRINLGADETCDGFDNDCDELVDESPVDTGDACGTGLAGQCAEGVQSCADGILACLPAVGPTDEACDGTDNDCNGEIDDGNPGGGASCGTGLPGACAVGARACTVGELLCEQTAFASTEVCDGADNDCDGSTDEGIDGVGGPCDTALPGACATGRQRCDDGTLACEQTTFASSEQCDGADNDCDGEVDEGNPGAGLLCSTGLLGECATGTTICEDGASACIASTGPTAEVCDQADNDCDGVVDNDNPGGGMPCGTGAPGVCSAGITVCRPSGLACEEVVVPSTEVCDGLDNNCSGASDEGNPGGGFACATGLLGVCSAGTTNCSGGEIACSQNLPASAELCDSLDNNCNGASDEGNPGGGVMCNTGEQGVCAAGTTVCSEGSLGCQRSVAPAAEFCDGLDNNCNGTADDGNPGGGFPCATGLPGICGSGTTSCTDGTVVCRQNASASTEVCDGLDNNCNGTLDEGNPGGGFACNTGGAGVCAAGTTNCSSGSVICSQNIVSSSEVCDGLDNDCDSTVDNGCPTGLSLGSGTSSPQYGGGGGGTFSAACPTGSAIVGFQIRSGSEVDALGSYCAPLTFSENRSTNPYTYPISTGTVQAMSFFGGGGGTYYTQQCPVGQVVIGIEGRAASRTDRWQWVCGSIRASGSPGSYSVVRNSLGSSSAYGGTGGDFFSFTCPDNQVATRFFGRSGSRIDAVGIQCSIPTLSIR